MGGARWNKSSPDHPPDGSRLRLRRSNPIGHHSRRTRLSERHPMPQYPSRARSLLGLASAIAALSSLAPVGLSAQDDDSGPVRVFTFNRPRIGVRVDTRPNNDTDKLGAR